MVSIESGMNNFYFQQQFTKAQHKTAGVQKTDGADGTNRAPSVPVFPDKKNIDKNAELNGQTYIIEESGFSSKEEAYAYINNQDNARDYILSTIAIFAAKNLGFSTPDFVYCEDGSCKLVDRYTGNLIGIDELQLDSFDIRSVEVVEKEDGTFSVRYSTECDVSFGYHIEVDWENGDTYCDENGYVWAYSDGKWTDVTNEPHVTSNNYDSWIFTDRSSFPKPVDDDGAVSAETEGGKVTNGVDDKPVRYGNGSDNKFGKNDVISSLKINDVQLSTKDFLKMRNVGINK